MCGYRVGQSIMFPCGCLREMRGEAQGVINKYTGIGTDTCWFLIRRVIIQTVQISWVNFIYFPMPTTK